MANVLLATTAYNLKKWMNIKSSYTTKKYPYPINSWKNNWNNLAVFFKYPEEIRKTIYTTNQTENLHRQFRKVTKNRALFPNNHSLVKMLYLASQLSESFYYMKQKL